MKTPSLAGKVRIGTKWEGAPLRMAGGRRSDKSVYEAYNVANWPMRSGFYVRAFTGAESGKC